jgi:hypothetical protein
MEVAKLEMSKPENYLGAMGYGGLCLVGVVSIGPIRKKWWLVFKFGHHVGNEHVGLADFRLESYFSSLGYVVMLTQLIIVELPFPRCYTLPTGHMGFDPHQHRLPITYHSNPNSSPHSTSFCVVHTPDTPQPLEGFRPWSTCQDSPILSRMEEHDGKSSIHHCEWR